MVIHWEVDSESDFQSYHPHLVVPPQWRFLIHKAMQSRLHPHLPPPTREVDHALVRVGQEDIGLTTWTYAHSLWSCSQLDS